MEFSSQTAQVFPNPGQNIISIQAPFEALVPVEVRIHSSLGQLVYLKGGITPSSGNTVLAEAIDVAPGVYFIQVQQGNKLFNTYWIRQ
jgi:hypothetical protein